MLTYWQPGGSIDMRKGNQSVNRDERIEHFYTKTAWRKCRAAFLQSKSGLCELCLKKGLIVPAEHVHHIKPITTETVDDPEITLNFGNLMALCEECHQEQHRTHRWRCGPDGHITI